MAPHVLVTTKRFPRPSKNPTSHTLARFRNSDLPPLLQLQHAIGNQAVNRLLQTGKLQAKLAVSRPGDVYEQEADRKADQVMRMPDAGIQPTCAPCAAGGSLCPQCAEDNNLKLQRTADSSGAATEQEVPDDVVRVLGPGQPLDATTRAFFEPRFDADFEDVRVHTDERADQSARAVDALAYTVGHHVVFGQGQYRPDSGAGRVLLAHELAHTIQQHNRTESLATNEGALEQDADAAVSAAMLDRPITLSSAAAPPIQFLKVTSGALGKALEVFTDLWNVPNRAILLLQKSPTFMKVAAVIDAHYVWRGDSYKIDPSAETDARGRLKHGPYKGKRELSDVIWGKPSFEPFEAPPEPGKIKLSGDVIQVESGDVARFISEIAHEATHAARFVGASTPPAANIVAEVKAGITDEVETRKSEAKILGEIPDKTIRGRVAQVGTRVPAEVERDISPALGLTYLENFFFGVLLREAQAKDGISEEDAEKVRDEVEKSFKGKALPPPTVHFKPQVGASGLYELSDYGEIWFNRRLVQAEWVEFSKASSPTDPDYTMEKEALLQDHAKRFFEGRVSYQPLP